MKSKIIFVACTYAKRMNNLRHDMLRSYGENVIFQRDRARAHEEGLGKSM